MLKPDDVEITEARDTKSDIKKAISKLASAHAWGYIGGLEGELIRRVFAEYENGIKSEMDAHYTWEKYMTANLVLLFDAEISESQEFGPFRVGDKVGVVELAEINDPYGTIVKLVRNRKGNYYPLCGLEAIDKTSSQHLPLHAYSVWFANK